MPDQPLPADKVDHDRARDAGPFDQQDTPTGEQYSRKGERTEGERHPQAHTDMRPDAQGRDIPPGNGSRANFSAQTGAVKGSGMGAGGGQAGEDFASDPATGSDYPITGGEGR